MAADTDSAKLIWAAIGLLTVAFIVWKALEPPPWSQFSADEYYSIRQSAYRECKEWITDKYTDERHCVRSEDAGRMRVTHYVRSGPEVDDRESARHALVIENSYEGHQLLDFIRGEEHGCVRSRSRPIVTGTCPVTDELSAALDAIIASAIDDDEAPDADDW